MELKSFSQVDATKAAYELITKLKSQHGELMFHQSGGCCDGSQPMCFVKGEFKTGDSDVCIGEIDKVQFWMASDQYEYWKHTFLTLDVVKGRGSSFSLEIPLGLRFIIRSRLLSIEEQFQLNEKK